MCLIRCAVPSRPLSVAMRMPISRVYKIKGVGSRGVVKAGEEVVFLPTHTASNLFTLKVNTVEMRHQRVDQACPDDNVGLNIKGLDKNKNNMPRSGDVMVCKKDTTLGQTREFNAQVQVLEISNEIKVGHSPIGFVRCRAACRISALKWKMEETGGMKLEDPHSTSPRDGRGLPVPAASSVRHLQKLRGCVPRGVLGRKRLRDARESCVLREEGRYVSGRR